jgi:acyl transferase domain-containing protein
MFGPDMSILLGAAKILSPEGKSKMWDANADGFARGEGIGVTILKVRCSHVCNFPGLRCTGLTCSCSL